MTDSTKCLFIRLPHEKHRKIKSQAIREGKTLQGWVEEILDKKLHSERSDCIRLCRACGKWDLSVTKFGMVGQCEQCGDETALYPCWEKK